MKTRHVLGFCFSPNLRQVLLIRKRRPSWQKHKLNGIGGKIEESEEPIQAMLRKFREETGSPDPLVWTPYGRLNGKGWEVHLFWATKDLDFWASHDSDEGVTSVYPIDLVLTVNPKESCPKPVANLRYLIPMGVNHSVAADPTVWFEIAECLTKSDDAILTIPINVSPGARFCEGCELLSPGSRCVYFGDLYRHDGEGSTRGLHERPDECLESERRG